MQTLLGVLLGAVLLSAALPLRAHHSFAAHFDATKPVTLTGAVTKVEWTNPHVWFYVDVRDDSGASANWAMEMGSPNALLRTGWTRNSMKVGDVVTVDGFRSRDGSTSAAAAVIVLVRTGQKLFAGQSPSQ
jgi:hypothetical protein